MENQKIYQKELKWNKYLPYQIGDEEPAKFLEEIKENLAKAAIIFDLKAFGVYISKLLSFLKLYGLRFSKQDHVNLVKLLLKLLTIPHLEPSKLNKICVCLNTLLRKNYLLSPSDISIEWRPLYELTKIYLNKRTTKGDLYRYFPSLEQNLQNTILYCTNYFPQEAIKEILDEVFPTVHPLDTGKGCVEFELLSLFLANSNSTADSPSYHLWFRDFMNIWNTYGVPANWNLDMMNLMAQTAAKTIGLIDWEPYIPVIFTRIMRSLEFPVSYKSIKSSKVQSLCSQASATFIVAVLGPKSSAMKYLRNLMSTIESYLHPANNGKWVTYISDLMTQLLKYFYDRLIYERYKIHPWKRLVPEEYKLTDENVTEFVECLKPVAMQMMYSKANSNDISRVFKHLADLRPELIIPPILERVNTTLDSLTEPHKFTQALQALCAVCSTLVSGRRGTENLKSFVLPTLFAVLPGIDANDFRKTSITLQYVISQCILIPFVDCSMAGQYYDSLSDEDEIVIGQTAQYEDFVLQFLDRLFLLIEAMDTHTLHIDTKLSRLETVSEALIQSSSHAILAQCSQEILTSATKKIINYIKSHLLDPKITSLATLLRVFARVNGRETYKAIVPYLIDYLENYFAETENYETLDKLSDEFSYHSVLLAHICRGDPTELQPYVDSIVPVIDKCLKCKCKVTNQHATLTLSNIVSNLSTYQTLDVKTVPQAFTLGFDKFLPTKNWAQRWDSTPFEWFHPTEKERAICERLIHHYLDKVFGDLNGFIDGQKKLTKEEVNLNLTILSAILKAHNFLPNWKEETIELYEGVKLMNLRLGFEGLQVDYQGKNIRLLLVDLLDRLQRKLLADQEDDIVSLKQLLLVWDKVHIRKHSNSTVDSQLKSFNSSKNFQEFKLTKNRKDIRAIIATRVIIQQDCRDELCPPVFTPTHRKIMMNMLELATSHYSSVRSTAQARLFGMFNAYSFSYTQVLDDIVQHLKLNPNDNHEAFKGALYCVATNRRARLIIKNDWHCVEKVWLALLKAQISEKPTIIKLMDSIMDSIYNEFQTVATEIEYDEGVVEYAENLGLKVTREDIESGKQKRQLKNQENREIYERIIGEIIGYVQQNSLHWRVKLMASSMLYNLMHPKTHYPAMVTQYFTHNLIHDSIEERKIAIKVLTNVMSQQKREHQKIKVDPFALAGLEKKANDQLVPGVRGDNAWLQYEVEKVPDCQGAWDQPRFIYKPQGFFGWKREFQVYAPSENQPKLVRNLDEMNEHEQAIYKFMMDDGNLDKFFEYWCLEEKKDRDKFNKGRFYFVKSLFLTFGPMLLDRILGRVEPLITDKTNEAKARCVSEMLAGIMRGVKHWNYEQTKSMFEKLQPLIRQVLENITAESQMDYGTSFATSAENMDPSKQYWLHECLLENPIQESTSFKDCSRLYCLQGAYNQNVWRMISVSNRLLSMIKPHLDHNFQILRERIASLLINIFELDLDFGKQKRPANLPKKKEFIQELMPRINILIESEVLDKEKIISEPNSEFSSAIRLFKTISQFVMGVINRCTNLNEDVFFELIPVTIRLQNLFDEDPELHEHCCGLLAMISQALILPQSVDPFLRKIEEVSSSTFWSSRVSSLDILQVSVFHNMPIFLSEPQWVERVQAIVLRLLEDDIIEVRSKSAELLGSLIHTSFLQLNTCDKLLELFKKKCRTKIKVNAVVPNCSVEIKLRDTFEASGYIQRHSGVLGLCAFINAFPYEIPEFIPFVFEHLSYNLNDPLPISSTIRKTLSDFKRTHDFTEIQLKFNEKQMELFEVNPPSYYA